MVLQRLLEMRAFRSVWLRTARQEWREFREWRPQFIWMDLRMPVMDGIETTRNGSGARWRAGREDRRRHGVGTRKPSKRSACRRRGRLREEALSSG